MHNALNLKAGAEDHISSARFRWYGDGGVLCGDIFWYTLGLLVTSEHHLNNTACLCNVADHVRPFITTVY